MAIETKKNFNLEELYAKWYDSKKISKKSLSATWQDDYKNQFEFRTNLNEGSDKETAFTDKQIAEEHKRFHTAEIRNSFPGSHGTEPYVMKDIGQNSLPNTRNLPIQSSADSIERTSKYLFSTEGLLWTAQQTSMQLLNARPETRLFNPLSIMTDVPGFKLSRVVGAEVSSGGIGLYSTWVNQSEEEAKITGTINYPDILAQLTPFYVPTVLAAKPVPDSTFPIFKNTTFMPHMSVGVNTTYATLAYGDLNKDNKYPENNFAAEAKSFTPKAPGDNILEVTYGLSKSVPTGGDRSDRKKIFPGTEDDVNMLGMNRDDSQKDFIPLKIYDMAQKRYIILRAFLNGLNESPSVEWNTKSYIGRPEKVYNYVGAERTFTFTVKVIAFSRQEMKPLWQKINYILGLNYPTYETSDAMMKAPIVKLTLGSLYKDTPGFFNSISIDYDDGFPWEIDMNNSEWDGGDEALWLPMGAVITFGFTIIGNDSLTGDGRQVFGLPDDWQVKLEGNKSWTREVEE